MWAHLKLYLLVLWSPQFISLIKQQCKKKNNGLSLLFLCNWFSNVLYSQFGNVRDGLLIHADITASYQLEVPKLTRILPPFPSLPFPFLSFPFLSFPSFLPPFLPPSLPPFLFSIPSLSLSSTPSFLPSTSIHPSLFAGLLAFFFPLSNAALIRLKLSTYPGWYTQVSTVWRIRWC